MVKSGTHVIPNDLTHTACRGGRRQPAKRTASGRIYARPSRVPCGKPIRHYACQHADLSQGGFARCGRAKQPAAIGYGYHRARLRREGGDQLGPAADRRGAHRRMCAGYPIPASSTRSLGRCKWSANRESKETHGLCQFSRRSARQIPAIFASTQAVARTARTIAVFRICRQRRTAAGTCWRIWDRHRRKFRSSS